MYLTRHDTPAGPRWAADGWYLPEAVTLGLLLAMSADAMRGVIAALPRGEAADALLASPVEDRQEVWAAGVTYRRSREAREAESTVKDVYSRVYDAPRPELFFKSVGWRVQGHDAAIRVRADSRWNVPEPELTIVANAAGEIVGYTVGNDVSSRDIEGDNPLYLPQAKVYDGSCAVGPGIVLAGADAMRDLAISVRITRGQTTAFEGAIQTSAIKRPLEELVGYLHRELQFPHGVFLLTGTGIVPADDAFSLTPGDVVAITVGEITLENRVAMK
jgi:2-dehydro-3-deoxy-D-arabinonate dehydratase